MANPFRGLTICDPVPRVLQTPSYLTLPATMQGGSPSDSNSPMREQRCREIKWLAQHHTIKCWRWGVSSLKLAGVRSHPPCSCYLTYFFCLFQDSLYHYGISSMRARILTFFKLLYAQYSAQCLAHSRCLIDTCLINYSVN